MRPFLISLLVFLAACAGTPAAAEHPIPAATPGRTAGSDAAPGGPSAAAPRSLEGISIADAVAVALERNPDLAMAAARIQAAEEAVNEAHSAFLPTIGASLTYTHTNDPVLAFMQELRNRKLTFSGNFNQPGQRGNARASAELEWLVYDSGRRRIGEDLARTGVKMSEVEREVVANGLKAAVIDTGLMAYEAQEFIQVAKDSVHLVEEQLKTAQSRFDAGAAQRSDVLTVEVRLAAAKEQLVRARNSRERADSALRNLLGVPSAEPFSLAPGGDFPVPPVEEDSLLEIARQNRPEILRAETAIEAAKRGVDLAGKGDGPTVSAFGSYDLDDQYGGFTLKQDSATAGFRLEVPIFDGYRTDAKVAKARAGVREAEAARRKVLLMIESDVTQARLKRDEARERLAVSQKSEEQAKEALALIRARYETGAATITEYLDAEVALTGARVRNVAARFDVERATADLRRALGICRAGTGGTNR